MRHLQQGSALVPVEAAVADSEVLVQIIEDQFPRAAKRPQGLETHCRLVGAEAAVEAVVLVAVSVAGEVAEHPVAGDGRSDIGCYTE